MKYIKLTILLLIFLLINSSSCTHENNEETLPPITQTGQNTFGCLVNGVVWRNEGSAAFASTNLNVTAGSKILKIGALKNANNIDQVVFITINTPISVVKYFFNTENQQAGFNDMVDSCYYTTDSISSTGTLEITKFDTINYIVSGIFNFKASKYSNLGKLLSKGTCDSTINITEGRFDFKYR